MADLIIDPALVIASGRARRASGLAGEAVEAGQAVYRDGAGRWRLVSGLGENTPARTPGGLALNGAHDGQPLAVHRRGPLDLGASLLEPGRVYYLSATPGGLCLLSDVADGEAIMAVGLAHSDRLLDVRLIPILVGDGVLDDPPVNVVPPSILGVAQVGELLSVDLGEWLNAPDSYAVQWRLNDVSIAGETDDEYLVDDADEGGVITVTVTATNAIGSTAETSAPTDPVEPADDPGGGEGMLDFSDPDQSGWLGAM